MWEVGGSGDSVNFAGKFNNGSVDVAYAPPSLISLS